MSKSNSQVHIGPKPIGAVQDSDEDSVEEFLGFLTFSTTGEVLVPREWLVEKWEEYNLPNSMLPRRPSNWSAYRRMKNELLEDAEYKHYSVYNDEYNQRFNCKFRIEKSDEMGSNTYIVYSETFFPEEIIGEDGGDWKRQRIGHMEFYRPEQDAPGDLVTHFDVEKDAAHYEASMRLAQRARDLYQEMKTHHNHSDIQNVLENFRDRTNAVAIRRAVYFVGSHNQELTENLSSLWTDLNQFKDDGEEMRIETTPVLNIESQREMVAERVRKKIEEMVDDIVGETLSKFEEDDDMTAEATAREIMNELSDSQNITSEYNALLSLRLSIKDILSEQREELKEEKANIVQSVIDQTDLENYK